MPGDAQGLAGKFYLIRRCNRAPGRILACIPAIADQPDGRLAVTGGYHHPPGQLGTLQVEHRQALTRVVGCVAKTKGLHRHRIKKRGCTGCIKPLQKIDLVDGGVASVGGRGQRRQQDHRIGVSLTDR